MEYSFYNDNSIHVQRFCTQCGAMLVGTHFRKWIGPMLYEFCREGCYLIWRDLNPYEAHPVYKAPETTAGG